LIFATKYVRIIKNEQRKQKMKIGILGLTANPVHLGHLNVALHAKKLVDEVWICPVFTHPFGKGFIDYPYRKKMIEIMFGNVDKSIKICEVDKEYVEKTGKMAYSYDLLCYLKEKYPEDEFKLVIGEDNYQPEVWKKFYNHEKIDNEFGVILAKDEGVHSTNIRQMLENHENIANYVGHEVANYILENHLYMKEVKKWKVR
jgi:cytidyltransferase-like protein